MTRARSKNAPSPVDPGVPSAGVAFGTPPSSGKGRYDWAEIASRCQARPGEWYQVFEQDKRTIYTAVRQGSVRLIAPSNGFEVRTANNRINVSPPVCDLWLRYVPEKDTSKTEKKGGKA